jgi:hypothetical protein
MTIVPPPWFWAVSTLAPALWNKGYMFVRPDKSPTMAGQAGPTNHDSTIMAGWCIWLVLVDAWKKG